MKNVLILCLLVSGCATVAPKPWSAAEYFERKDNDWFHSCKLCGYEMGSDQHNSVNVLRDGYSLVEHRPKHSEMVNHLGMFHSPKELRKRLK